MQLIYACSLDCIRQSANRSRQIVACKCTLSWLPTDLGSKFRVDGFQGNIQTLIRIIHSFQIRTDLQNNVFVHTHAYSHFTCCETEPTVKNYFILSFMYTIQSSRISVLSYLKTRSSLISSRGKAARLCKRP